MNSPLVSIIVPSYNHKRFIEKLVDSIYGQTYSKFELIILDDGSADGSPELLQQLSEKHHFKLVLKKNEGLCKTLNKGLELASGELVVIIASDDFMPSTRLAEQVQYFIDDLNLDVVAGASYLVDTVNEVKDTRIPAKLGLLSFEDLVFTNHILAPTAMIKKSAYDRFGKYNESFPFEDFPFWLNVLRNGGKILNTNSLWAYYRMDNVNIEKKINWYYKGTVSVLSQYIEVPMVRKRIHTLHRNFAVKLALIHGISSRKYLSEVSIHLNGFEKPMVFLLGFMPRFLREKLLELFGVRIKL